MTVKDVFELRKQGKIEEAYEAIRPMYAVHKGKYTTLCMFWTASDIMKKRLTEKRVAEAEKIFEALLRVQPAIDDKDGKVHEAIVHGALRIKEASQTFRMLDFVERYGMDRLKEEDWRGTTSQEGNHPLPSTARRMLTCCFHELKANPTVENALKMMPLLQESVRRHPRDKHNLRYMAMVYCIMGEKEKAVDLYRQLLTRHRDSYLYAELADLTDDPGQKAALLCRAIMNQRQELFRSGYRFALATLLISRDKPKAAHELQKCVACRKAQGFPVTRDLQSMLAQLQGVTPATDAQQMDFYRKMAEKFKV